ncbi:MAG: UDP-N-acetylmuramoyl-L-alanine--D-glutamate ligase [Epsilonproteobacteria bacterium]|nr:UDP-N-acetylmuramoyl-L-alanine--D-glutamate ligase [Campylobacterota bacterium]
MMQTSLFGYGKTTKALARVVQNPVFFDDKCHKPFRDKEGFLVRPSSDFDPKQSSLEITSPGIPPSNPLIINAQNLQSEYDFFAAKMPRSIWISGTNGKTTTTQMMEFILKDKDVQSGGNIGRPLAEMDQDKALWILETSSFTLHYTNIAKPDIYILLPIKPDHLYWHGNFEAYADAKLKPLTMLREGEVAIIPKEYLNRDSNGMLIGYETVEDLAEYFEIDINQINFKGAFLLDAVLALAVEKILFDTISYEKINSFKLDPHRQEEFLDRKKRVWIDDSKATNVDATMVALERYKHKQISLILGGDDKGVSLDELFKYLKTLHVKTYHIGANTQKLNTLAKKYGIDFESCEILENAVVKIDKEFQENAIALLSPAAASLDQFNSYIHRGKVFKELVQGL